MGFSFPDRVQQLVTSTGTGTLTLGAALAANTNTINGAGIADGSTVPYVLTEGNNVEWGQSVTGSSGTTATRVVAGSIIAGTFSTSAKISLLGSGPVFTVDLTGEVLAALLVNSNNLSDVSSPIAAADNLSVHGTDIASAATLNLQSATGNFVHVTGTTAITAITLSDGHQRTVKFTGALTLTNGSSLVLPGGANITTAAGDVAVFVGDGGNVICTDYCPASGLAVAGAGALAKTAVAQTANNGSDFANVATALNNLGGVSYAASQSLTAAQQTQALANIGAVTGGLVNKFRNGTMDVWQRGTSAITVTTSGAYTADGWIVTPTGASCTAVQATNNRTGANTLYGLQVTGATSVTDITVAQRIESYIAAGLAGKTVTVQAQVYNNTGGSITPKLQTQYAGSTDSWGSPTTDLSATNLQACANGAWTQVAYTLSVSSSATKGYAFIFDFGNNFSTTGKDVVVAELDVRVTPNLTTGLNSYPPTPELRLISIESGLCQRYFYNGVPALRGVVATTALANRMGAPHPVLMRASPTVTMTSSISLYDGAATTSASSIAVNYSTTNDLEVDFNLSTALTQYRPAVVYQNGGNINVSAEL